MTQQQTKYENKNPIHQWVLNQFLDHVVKAVSASKAKNILDMASADGYVIQRLSAVLPHVSFTGVDIDAEALQRARMLNPQATFVEGNIYTYQHSEPVDLVMALEVLEHLDQYPKAIDNLLKVGAPQYLLSVPHEPFFRTLNFMRGRHVSRLGNHPEHVNLWTKSAFKKMVSEKFTIVEDYSSFPWTMLLVKPR